MYKKWFSLAIAVLLLFGCSRGPQQRPQEITEKDKVKVAVISANTTSDNYSVFRKTLEDKGKKENLEFIWLDSKSSVLQQEENIVHAVQKKAKVIVLETIDSRILREPITAAQKEGVKFIVTGALPPDTAVDAYISPDFTRAGEIQAQQLLQEIGNDQQSKILVLRGSRGNPVADSIYQGNLNILRNDDRLWVEEVGDTDTAKTYDKVKEYLARPDRPAAILAHSPEHTEGMLMAIQESSVRDLITIGFGTQKKAVEALEKGTHTAEVDLMPELLAQIVAAAAKDLSGDEPWQYEMQVNNGSHDIPARFSPLRSITKDNVHLIKDRFKGQGNEKTEETRSSSSEQGTQGNPPEGGSGEQGKKTVITIKTKEGQEFKMDINGEIVSVEMKAKEGQEGESKEGSE